MSRSYVVTGGGRGLDRALVERLLGDDDSVVTIETGGPRAGYDFSIMNERRNPAAVAKATSPPLSL
jgi:NAD(P)-dependent dehydrogenase (short-subunit alcohol dehydrogenase family)